MNVWPSSLYWTCRWHTDISSKLCNHPCILMRTHRHTLSLTSRRSELLHLGSSDALKESSIVRKILSRRIRMAVKCGDSVLRLDFADGWEGVWELQGVAGALLLGAHGCDQDPLLQAHDRRFRQGHCKCRHPITPVPWQVNSNSLRCVQRYMSLSAKKKDICRFRKLAVKHLQIQPPISSYFYLYNCYYSGQCRLTFRQTEQVESKLVSVYGQVLKVL